MVNGIEENMFLVNAPAGSGKTTKIRTMITESLMERPQDKILCITYTKRATEEIKKTINSEQVWVSTIHAFLNHLISPYYSYKCVIDLYIEIFKEQISSYLENPEKAKNIKKYKEKMGIQEDKKLTVEIVKENLKRIDYGEKATTMLLYGSLSHDDLILFSYELCRNFEVIYQKIQKGYKKIYIDEYQDTDAKVLQIFYNVVKGSSTELYILGDKMQQIYSNYDGSFEKQLRSFRREKLRINYRSTPNIISVLNNIYGDKEFEQIPSNNEKEVQYEKKPEIIIASDVESVKSKIVMENEKILTLVLMNSDRFDSIGAGNLYRSFKTIPKYNRGKESKTAEILQQNLDDAEDDIMKLLYIVDWIIKSYQGKVYGRVITIAKEYYQILSRKNLQITNHGDKEKLWIKLKELENTYQSGVSIGEFITYLDDQGYLEEKFSEALQSNETLEAIRDVKLEEFRNLREYLLEPHISTQHGVKGESHDEVLFIAEDSTSSINVRMYKFFELWSNMEISLSEFEKFYYEYKEDVERAESKKRIKSISNANEYKEKWEEYFKENAQSILKKNKQNKFFINLCLDKYEEYLEATKVFGRAQKCFSKNLGEVYGTLQAYRIFYVGCSRARKNLKILVNAEKIKGYEEKFEKKVRDIGFEIKYITQEEKIE